ncbi:MAG: hypothetical protein LBU87_05840 [Lactobacillales bacterium]|jgi:hypothetical protein|nr:hypothetical protein [Lactobacillales bacterium]
MNDVLKNGIYIYLRFLEGDRDYGDCFPCQSYDEGLKLVLDNKNVYAYAFAQFINGAKRRDKFNFIAIGEVFDSELAVKLFGKERAKPYAKYVMYTRNGHFRPLYEKNIIAVDETLNTHFDMDQSTPFIKPYDRAGQTKNAISHIVMSSDEWKYGKTETVSCTSIQEGFEYAYKNKKCESFRLIGRSFDQSEEPVQHGPVYMIGKQVLTKEEILKRNPDAYATNWANREMPDFIKNSQESHFVPWRDAQNDPGFKRLPENVIVLNESMEPIFSRGVRVASNAPMEKTPTEQQKTHK